MRLRSRGAHFVLLLLASLVSVISTAGESGEQGLQQARHDVGTKDAPVDGKDGKPHDGPFVDAERNRDSVGINSVDASSRDYEVLKARPTDAVNPSIGTSSQHALHESNAGVMDDRNRDIPKIGTTGTEGGVSEKAKQRKVKEDQTGAKEEKKPATPKEAPPLPHSELEKMQNGKESKEIKEVKDKEQKEVKDAKDKNQKDGDVSGLEKPGDLPDRVHDTPHPLPDSANKHHLELAQPKAVPGTVVDDGGTQGDDEGLIQPLHSFVLSLAMILFSEVGDKTFLVAALMAMKYDRIIVFTAAFGALLVMTVLSAVLGHAVPALISKRLTHFAAAALFFGFGAKLLHEGLAMSRNEGVSAELREVERELAEKEKEAAARGRAGGRGRLISTSTMEMGLAGPDGCQVRSLGRLPSPPRSPSTSPGRRASTRRSVSGTAQGINNLMMLLLSPAWVQTFAMTFLGEWGDRSQIATIAMAAGQDYYWVTLGAVLGHAICTGVAVVGGRAIAGHVSLKVVTVGGASVFLVFGVIYLCEALFYA